MLASWCAEHSCWCHWLAAAGPLPDLAAQAPGQAPGSTSSGSSGSDSEQRQPGGSGGSGMRFPAQCPQSDIRLFIGITSRCCTADVRLLADAYPLSLPHQNNRRGPPAAAARPSDLPVRSIPAAV